MNVESDSTGVLPPEVLVQFDDRKLAEAFATLENLLPSQPQLAQAAARDTELAALRADPVYGERLRALTGGARVP